MVNNHGELARNSKIDEHNDCKDEFEEDGDRGRQDVRMVVILP